MTWQHKFNEAFGEYAGVRFARVSKAAPKRAICRSWDYA
jgi:hypothetical protein